MITFTRIRKTKYFKIVICIIGLAAIYDFRVPDMMLSGASTKIIFNNLDMEKFTGEGFIETTDVHKLYARATLNKHAKGAKTMEKINFECPEKPPNLTGKLSFQDGKSSLATFEDAMKANPKVTNGGHFSPECTSRHRVAIIIPFRDRERQLKILLAHMHPIWQRQQIEYKVFVINQAGNGIFNKAKLMNIGVAAAEKDGKFDCYVFQDVDLLLEDDRCLYWCHKDNPRHISVYVDKFSYTRHTYLLRCPPLAMFIHEQIPLHGGVTMLSPEQFRTINGFSNLYWGWGGEDDDVYMRIWNRGYRVENPYGRHCSFRMIEHNHADSKNKNKGALPLLFHSISRMDVDGYETIRYRHLKTEVNKLYTNITVDVGQPSQRMKKFMSQGIDLGFAFGCKREMPWDM